MINIDLKIGHVYYVINDIQIYKNIDCNYWIGTAITKDLITIIESNDNFLIKDVLKF